MISLAASRSTWPAHQAYFAQTGAHVIVATAHGATAGFWWILNPVTSAVRVLVLRVDFVAQPGSVLATPTSPRITLERMTFTGTPSGASVTPAAALSGAPAATGTLRTASTGITPAAGAALRAFMPSAALTAVAAVSLSEDDFSPDEPIELTAGQGIVCRQSDSGSASDTRRFATTVHWIEV